MKGRYNFIEEVGYRLGVTEAEYNVLTTILRQIGMRPEELLKRRDILEVMPDRIEIKHDHVVYLDLSYLGLRSLDESVSKLRKLKRLDVGGNSELNLLPGTILELSRLEELAVYSTPITSRIRRDETTNNILSELEARNVRIIYDASLAW